MKKIPRGQQRPPSDHLKAEGSTIPDFKPVQNTDSSYSFPNVVGKFFSASSSLQPDGPPTASHQTNDYDDNREVLPLKEHKAPEYSGPPQVQESDREPSKPTPAYYHSLTNQKPNTFSTDYLDSPEKYKDSTKSTKLNELDAIKNALRLQSVENHQNPAETSVNNQPNLPSKPEDLPSIDSFGSFPGAKPPEFVNNYGLLNQGFTLPSFPVKPLNLEELQSQTFDPKNGRFQINAKLNSPTPINMKPPRTVSGVRIPPPFLRHPVHDNVSYSSQKRPTKLRHHTRQAPTRQKGPYDVVKSISYELTPNGPVQL